MENPCQTWLPTLSPRGPLYVYPSDCLSQKKKKKEEEEEAIDRANQKLSFP
jgi:hypothetical protein